MNNSVYWSVVEDYLSTTPELLRGPIRVTIEHEAPITLGDKLEIIAHVHPAGSTDKFGPELVDRTVTTLTYANVTRPGPSHPSSPCNRMTSHWREALDGGQR
jgi:acyl-ACP thioesterase